MTQTHLSDVEFLIEGPVKFITRVRNGKVVRRARVKTSKRRGFKLRGNRVVRQSPAESRNRRRAAIKGARKRRSKRAQINRKRARSLLRRNRLHLKRK